MNATILLMAEMGSGIEDPGCTLRDDPADNVCSLHTTSSSIEAPSARHTSAAHNEITFAYSHASAPSRTRAEPDSAGGSAEVRSCAYAAVANIDEGTLPGNLCVEGVWRRLLDGWTLRLPIKV
ncbi:MAG TPA: hypothetical protein VK638_53490 [Edaphobacter sp.]|nr:hypothetical protein [Edaphobacter sp.]